MMMLDIDGILSRHAATPVDLLVASQAIAASAIGDLANKGTPPEVLHRVANGFATQLAAALHKRIDEGKRPDW